MVTGLPDEIIEKLVFDREYNVLAECLYRCYSDNNENKKWNNLNADEKTEALKKVDINKVRSLDLHDLDSKRINDFLEVTFPNLKHFSISNTIDNSYANISKYLPQITSLEISYNIFQGEQIIDLKMFPNIESLFVKSNKGLTEIKNLNTNTLDCIEIYDNPDLETINNDNTLSFLTSILNKNNVRLDAIYFKEIVNSILSPQRINQLWPGFERTCWIDPIAIGDRNRTGIEYSTKQMINFTSTMEKILYKLGVKNAPYTLYKIGLIYKYIVDNTQYDSKNLKNHTNSGIIGGTNSLVSALYHKEVVCQGYTKLFQHLLNLCDIKTQDTLAFIDNDKTKKEENVSLFNLPPECTHVNHSIMKIYLDGKIYYCDPTNECSPKDGIFYPKRFMLTRNDFTNKFYLPYESWALDIMESPKPLPYLTKEKVCNLKPVELTNEKIENLRQKRLNELLSRWNGFEDATEENIIAFCNALQTLNIIKNTDEKNFIQQTLSQEYLKNAHTK